MDLKKGKLYRSVDRVFGGVCAGLADFFKVDTLFVRIAICVLAVIATVPVAITYIILWLILPSSRRNDEEIEVSPQEAYSELSGTTTKFAPVGAQNEESNAEGSVGSREPAGKRKRWSVKKPDIEKRSLPVNMAVIVALILLGILVVFISPTIMHNTSWYQFLPTVLVIFGLGRMIVPPASGYAVAPFLIGFVCFTLGLVCLPFSLGILSLKTVLSALMFLWPFLAASLAFLIMSKFLHPNLCIFMAVLCYVFFIVLMFLLFAVPGSMTTIDLHVMNKGITFVTNVVRECAPAILL